MNSARRSYRQDTRAAGLDCKRISYYADTQDTRGARQVNMAFNDLGVLDGHKTANPDIYQANLSFPSVVKTQQAFTKSLSARSHGENLAHQSPIPSDSNHVGHDTPSYPGSSRTVWHSQTARHDWSKWYATSYSDQSKGVPVNHTALGQFSASLVDRDPRVCAPDSLGKRRRAPRFGFLDHTIGFKTLVHQGPDGIPVPSYPEKVPGLPSGSCSNGREWWMYSKHNKHTACPELKPHPFKL